MGDMTREELAAMTDQELLAYEREHHGDPYLTLLQAKGMQRVALQFWHVGAAWTRANREAEAEARRRLRFRPTPLVSLSPTAEGACPSGPEIPCRSSISMMNSPCLAPTT